MGDSSSSGSFSDSSSETVVPLSSTSSRSSSIASDAAVAPVPPEGPPPGARRELGNKELIFLLILAIIAFIIIIFIVINPKKSIVENAKYVYNASLEKMNTTYGTEKTDAEKAAQNAKDKWTSNLQSIYKIILLSITVFLLLLFLVFHIFSIVDIPNMIKYPLYVLLVSFFGFEFVSNIVDDALIKLFNSIDTPTDKSKQSTFNFGLLGVILFWIIANSIQGIYLINTNIPLLPVQTTNKYQYFISIAINVLSAIAVLFSIYFDKQNMTEYKGFVFFLLFVLGIVANVLFMINFNANINSWLPNIIQIIFNILFIGLLIFELLSNQIDDAIHKNTIDNNIHHKTLSSVFTIGLFFASLFYYKYPKKSDFLGENINIAMIAVFFLLSLFVLFNFPGFDSEYYIFVLFFIVNIPIVYLFINRMLSGTDAKTKLFIPLLIGFYTIFMIILAMMGTLDMSNYTNIYLLVGLIGFLLLSYTTKYITHPTYKTLFILIALIILSITTLYYTLSSNIWYVYLTLFIAILIYFDIIHIPYKPEMPSLPKTNITPLEKKLLAGEIAFIFLFLYIRPLLKTTYTTSGEFIINQPINLNTQTNIKISKKFKYIYGLSCWVKLDPMPPGSIPQANEYIPILSYGNTPKISYCGALNRLRVEMQNKSKKMRIIGTIHDVPLQKWNHIAINYVDGTCDVFINGELHNTKMNIIPYNESSELIIGSQYNIRGEICNTTYFHKPFTRAKINQLYTQFKDRSPPIF